jgi:hypothetical protein
VLLEQGQKGSFAVCVSEAEATERVGMGLVTGGSQLCVRTAAGHVALVTFEALPAVEDELTVDVTVWRDAR